MEDQLILGIGIDLVEIEDFERTLSRSGEGFLTRVFTEDEIEYCRSQPHAHQSFAVRFAAKEAAMKALSVAGAEHLKWRDFEVICTESGKPEMRLNGVAAEKAESMGIQHLLLALSHSRSTAAAVLIAEAEYPRNPRASS